MPFTIQYGPAGLAGVLAAQAGAAEGQRRNDAAANSLQAAAWDADARMAEARNRAMELQLAHADRLAAMNMRTPAAQHIAGALTAEQIQKQQDTKGTIDLLGKKLSSGEITQSQYDTAMVGVHSGVHNLVEGVLAPKTDKTQERFDLDQKQKLAVRASSQKYVDSVLASGQITPQQHALASLAAQSDNHELMVRALTPKVEVDPLTKPVLAAKLKREEDQRHLDTTALSHYQKAAASIVDKGTVPPGAIEALQKKIQDSFDRTDQIIAEASRKPGAAGYVNPLGGGEAVPVEEGGPVPIPVPGVPADLPDPRQYPEGQHTTKNSTGEQFIIRGGQWVPYQPPAAPQPQAALQQPPVQWSNSPVSSANPGM